MKVTKTLLKMNFGMQNMHRNAKLTTVDLHLLWSLKELDEFSTVQSAHITFNITSFMDSKSFNAVKNVCEEEYGVVVEKKECVGHVQKRLGTALRKLKKEKKGLGGKESAERSKKKTRRQK